MSIILICFFVTAAHQGWRRNDTQVDGSYKMTALLIGAYKGFADVVSMLLAAGVDPNQCDSKVGWHSRALLDHPCHYR